MTALHTLANASSFLGLVLLVASQAHAELDRTSTAHLASLSATPEQAGELIYQGATFAPELAGPDPLFRYERRLTKTPNGFEATHLTRDPLQTLVVAESARFNAAYELQRYVVQNQQLAFSGAVQVSRDGRHLRYSLNDAGVVSTAEESIDAPAVAGPSLFGFILAHGSELGAGKSIPVRFIVMNEKQTYGFDIRQASATEGRVVYSITPSSWFVRPFIATMRATFDTNSKTWVRYDGRVPPMQTVAGELKALDARVDYTAVAAPYR